MTQELQTLLREAQADLQSAIWDPDCRETLPDLALLQQIRDALATCEGAEEPPGLLISASLATQIADLLPMLRARSEESSPSHPLTLSPSQRSLSAAQACRVLGVCRQRLRQLHQAGLIRACRHFRPGSIRPRWSYDAESIRMLLLDPLRQADRARYVTRTRIVQRRPERAI